MISSAVFALAVPSLLWRGVIVSLPANILLHDAGGCLHVPVVVVWRLGSLVTAQATRWFSR